MSPENPRPGETHLGSSSDRAEVVPVPLIGSGSDDDGLGALAPDRDLALGAVDPAIKPAGPGTAEVIAAIDTAPTLPTPSALRSSDGEDDEPTPKTSWPMVLLGSYASAVTLALAWVLLTRPARGPAELPSPASTPTEARAAPRAEPVASGGRKVEPVAAIPDDRRARFGEALRVGSLEITPLDARRQPVTLRRVALTGKAVETRGKPGTIVLRLMLRNASPDLVFAPLDPSFVRQGDKVNIDCFAETPAGDRIYPYPLAVESELAIVGQEFGDLRPGESRVVALATAPDVGPVDPGTLAWRLRLRTGLDRTEAIGVEPASGRPKSPK